MSDKCNGSIIVEVESTTKWKHSSKVHQVIFTSDLLNTTSTVVFPTKVIPLRLFHFLAEPISCRQSRARVDPLHLCGRRRWPRISPNRFTRVISADGTFGSAEPGFHRPGAAASSMGLSQEQTVGSSPPEHLLQQSLRLAAHFFSEDLH